MYVYDVYDLRHSGLPVIVDGDADRARKAMGLTLSSFHSAITLSKEGKSKSWEVRKHMERRCIQCGTVFYTRYSGKKYCSEKCKKHSADARYRDRQKVLRAIHKDQEDKAQKKAKPLPMPALDRMSGEDLLHYGKLQMQAQLRVRK